MRGRALSAPRRTRNIRSHFTRTLRFADTGDLFEMGPVENFIPRHTYTCKSSVCQHSARAQLLNARNYRRPTCTAKGPKSPGLLMGDLISRANGKKNISIANGVIHIH